MRLIDGDELIEKAKYEAVGMVYPDKITFPSTVEWLVEKMPTIAPERKRGRWQISDAYPHNVYCSECHKRFAQTHWAVWEDGSLPRNFCPNCGAEMQEGET